jgi:hypothetical protein
MSECRYCRQPVMWGRLPNGRFVALDPTPDPRGTFALLRDDHRVLPLGLEQVQAARPEVRERLHRPHDQVCSGAASFGGAHGAATGPDLNRERVRAYRVWKDKLR